MLTVGSGAERSPDGAGVACDVLVVDADPSTATAVRGVLDRAARVRAVPDGYQALHELGLAPADLVVLELFLPGASGVDVLRRIRARGSRVPVVVVTHAQPSVSSLRALGVHAVLHKPVVDHVLASTVRAALDSVLLAPS